MERFTGRDRRRQRRRGGAVDADDSRSGAPARYLDGGYGVGKTHLLAAAVARSAGAEGVPHVRRARAAHRVPRHGAGGRARSPAIGCSASTSSSSTTSHRRLMTVTFLRAVIARRHQGRRRRRTRCPTVSARVGSPPMTSRARSRRSHRTSRSCGSTVPTTGPRLGSRPSLSARASSMACCDACAPSGATVSDDAFADADRPPAGGAAGSGRRDARGPRRRGGRGGSPRSTTKGAALLFVHLVDEIYDAGITFVASGVRR